LQYGSGQVLVDHVVAELERFGLVAADVRRVRQVPQVVLDEPQHGVGDDVVEGVVGLRLGGHELDAIITAVRDMHGERPPLVVVGGQDVLVGHGRGDPGDLAVGGQTGERGDQPPSAAPYLPIRPVCHRAAVGYQDQGTGHQTSSCSNTFNQSRSS